MPHRLVVVGASLAGLRAVEGARSAGYQGEISLVGEELWAPYDRTSLAKAYLTEQNAEMVTLISDRELRDDLGVDLHLGERAQGLDLAARDVVTDRTRIRYDALVIATGATPRQLPGTEGLRGVSTLRTLDDARDVRTAMDAGARVIIIGAGFIGSEVASAAHKRGLSVTLIEAMPTPLSRSVGPAVGEMLTDLHREAGTAVRLGVGVEQVLHANGQVTGVRLADGSVVEADLVVAGLGVTPATGWLGAAVDLHRDGGIVCDASLATSVPGIWAAGDVAHAPQALFDGELMRLEHWTNAAEQGSLAGRNAVSRQEPELLDSVPYFWSDWYGHRVQFVGTPGADEVLLVGPPGPGAIALYRRGNRVVGALTVDRQRVVMKLRRRIADAGDWDEAVTFARELDVLAVTR
ncbi:MAG: hcaD [Frankiales bacterium]|jgi:NADPH-dependent 2,4-dienoyl-CoA reductase/sulfur reductase-like enzyme|nr:hcaD [Frankiales bacterium]